MYTAYTIRQLQDVSSRKRSNPNTSDGMQTLIFKPLDPGIVLEKLVVDYGGYKKSYLFMNESKSKRDNR